MVLFWQADSVAWLLSARILQGVATGIAAAALGAGLVDLHPERGALVNSIAPMVVLGIGALGASVLLLFASEPTRLVFEVLFVAFATQLAAAFFLPETAQRRRGARRTLRPSLSVPEAARTTLARVLPVNTAQWALGGFYFSLGPTVARTVTGSSMPLVGGLMIAALSLSSALAIAASRRFAPSDAIRAGAMALVAGVLVTLAGMHWGFAAVALARTVVAGPVSVRASAAPCAASCRSRCAGARRADVRVLCRQLPRVQHSGDCGRAAGRPLRPACGAGLWPRRRGARPRDAGAPAGPACSECLTYMSPIM